MTINKLVCSAKRSFRKGCRENPIERVVPLRLCILSSYKERMCRVQGGISACIGLIGALLAIRPLVRLCTRVGKTDSSVAHRDIDNTRYATRIKTCRLSAMATPLHSNVLLIRLHERLAGYALYFNGLHIVLYEKK